MGNRGVGWVTEGFGTNELEEACYLDLEWLRELWACEKVETTFLVGGLAKEAVWAVEKVGLAALIDTWGD